MSTLQSWLVEFADLGYPVGESAKVIPQDGDDGADTGLVVFELAYVRTQAYLAPRPGSFEWSITLESREGPTTMTPANALALSSQMSVVAALGTFLQAKSYAYLHGARD